MENVSAKGRTVATKSRGGKTNKVERLSSKKNEHRVAKAPKKASKPREEKVVVQVAAPIEVPTAVETAPAMHRSGGPVRNMERFLEATGKTQQDYYKWATEVGRRMHINKLDALVCAKMEVYAVSHLVNRPTVIPDGLAFGEVDEFLVVHSENPFELAALWLKARADAENWVSKESILSEWLTGIRKEDFEHYGDTNHAGDVSKKWWVKDAVALDAKLHEMNGMQLLNAEITAEDAIDFIKANKPGSWKNPMHDLVRRIEERFKVATTFRIKEYYVEHLLKSCQVAVGMANDDDLPF